MASTITFEVCCNTEWLRENFTGAEFGDETAELAESELHSRLSAAGFETERAKGQRIMYHGWNGANTFRHLLGPVGTFDSLTKEQEAAAWDAIEAARESVCEKQE